MGSRFSCGFFLGVLGGGIWGGVGFGSGSFGLGFVGAWALVRGFLSFGCVFAYLGACLGVWVRVCLVWRRRWGARV